MSNRRHAGDGFIEADVSAENLLGISLFAEGSRFLENLVSNIYSQCWYYIPSSTVAVDVTNEHDW